MPNNIKKLGFIDITYLPSSFHTTNIESGKLLNDIKLWGISVLLGNNKGYSEEYNSCFQIINDYRGKPHLWLASLNLR